MVKIKKEDLVMPYFVIAGAHKKEPVVSMPGIARLSIDNLLKDILKALASGIKAVLLFGICPRGRKDVEGSYAYSADSVVAQAVKAVKKAVRDITVITDVCLCAYTSHGHCGVLKGPGREIDSKKTLKALSNMALRHAEAGADYVAPSAMAKKQVAAIRKALDKNGFRRTKIMGYSAKFASNFYGPFRNAAGSAPEFGDRSGYQLDYKDRAGAIKEIETDIKEGADIVMVKPALSYLDIIKEAGTKFRHPLAAYNVSGEYAMVKAYCRSLGPGAKVQEAEKKLVLEILTGIKRAGADLIISYHAKDAAKWLKQ
ncbi:MAG: porphobilinogen synthase [Candidatus Omnitrophota bacterium]|nr:porphobilinogen synthase [Candidatus Omnitrophota bacterium]